nr:hypothetical protein [uncultured Prevotella sp.]
MDQFKLDFFKKDFKNKVLNFSTRSKDECEKIYTSFCLAYKIKRQERNNIFSIIQDKGRCINSINAEDRNFNLERLLYEQNIKQVPTQLNICWDFFSTIDTFESKDIVHYFDYIWYPAADDIIIFDNLYTICLMVRHDGVIYVLNRK